MLVGRFDGHVDEVAHKVVGRDVIRPNSRVVTGSAPILVPPELEVAILVGLEDGKGDAREDVTGGLLLKYVHAPYVMEGGRSCRQAGEPERSLSPVLSPPPDNAVLARACR